MGTGCPRVSMPMRRVKKRSTACGVPAEKMPAFSRKKGRFSGKNNGKRVRFVRCSSTSTCAKSVLYVRSRVKLGVTPYLISPPTSLRLFASGSTAKLRSTPVSAYGVAVRTRRAGTRTPVSVPACEIFISENWRGTNDQNDSSFLRRIERTRLSPHVCCSPGPYRNVVNGMRNSAYHPAESFDVATVHVPSQLRLNPPSDPALARV